MLPGCFLEELVWAKSREIAEEVRLSGPHISRLPVRRVSRHASPRQWLARRLLGIAVAVDSNVVDRGFEATQLRFQAWGEADQ